MITVEHAWHMIAEQAPRLTPVICELSEAQGLTLREDISADRDIPPYNRVMMDGIAIAYGALEAGFREFTIVATQPAGKPPLPLHDRKNSCIQIMTGAVLPDGCDCIIPYEDLLIENDLAKLKPRVQPQHMQYIHIRGSDKKQGEVLLQRGIRMLSPQIAIAAAVGKQQILVGRRPSIAVIANGDELVELGRDLRPWQIRPSNSYALRAALRSQHFDHTSVFLTRDDRDKLTRQLGGILEEYDVIILSGGVSMGEYDFIPSVLENLGVKKIFHKISQRPGKPFWFGQRRDRKPVFALPGNPVSTLVCFHRYVLPFLLLSTGASARDIEYVTLGTEVNFEPPLTYFLPVNLEGTRTQGAVAVPVEYHNSGDFTSLAQSDGFVELTRDLNKFPKGTPVRFHRWSC